MKDQTFLSLKQQRSNPYTTQINNVLLISWFRFLHTHQKQKKKNWKMIENYLYIVNVILEPISMNYHLVCWKVYPLVSLWATKLCLIKSDIYFSKQNIFLRKVQEITIILSMSYYTKVRFSDSLTRNRRSNGCPINHIFEGTVVKIYINVCVHTYTYTHTYTHINTYMYKHVCNTHTHICETE